MSVYRSPRGTHISDTWMGKHLKVAVKKRPQISLNILDEERNARIYYSLWCEEIQTWDLPITTHILQLRSQGFVTKLPKPYNVKVWPAPLWFITQWVLVISYRSFGNDSLETSVINYHHSLSNNPEERSSYPLRGGSLNNAMVTVLV